MKIIRRALSALLASLLLVAAFFAPASAATIQAGYSASLLARQEGTGALFSYGGGSSGYLYGGQVGHGWGGFDYGFQIDSLNGSTYGDVIVRSPDGLLRIYHSDGEHLRGGYEIGHGWQAMSAMVPVSDWDGDGLPDILARTDDGRLKLYPTRGAGRWGHVREVGHGWNTMDFIVSPGDLTGDGNADLVARRQETGDLYLYPGNGHGGFLPTKQIGHGWGGFANIAASGDLDGDGIADIIGQHSDGRLFLYPGKGNGYFWSAQQIGHGWHSMTLPGPWKVTAVAPPPAPRPAPRPKPTLRQPFVYGTLRVGDRGYHMVKGRTLSEDYAAVPGYQLWITHRGTWPWAIKEASARPLVGQIMEFPESTLAMNLHRLDVYEGYYPDRPRNSMRYWRAPATTSDGIPVWIYQTTDRQAVWVKKNGYYVASGDWYHQSRSAFGLDAAPYADAQVATDVPVRVDSAVTATVPVRVDSAVTATGCTSDLGTLAEGQFLHVDMSVTAPADADNGYVSVPAESFVALDSRGLPFVPFTQEAKFCSARADALAAFVDAGASAGGQLTFAGDIAQLFWVDDDGTPHLIWSKEQPASGIEAPHESVIETVPSLDANPAESGAESDAPVAELNAEPQIDFPATPEPTTETK